MTKRLKNIFSDKGKKLITFVTGGDPDISTSEEILKTIIEKKVDIIEIGMPFSDPMADGPTIQLSSRRAIKNKTNLKSIFKICKNIRKYNNSTPIVLMGYYNLILHYGVNNFTKKCSETGIDGLIIVDLQPEEDSELYNAISLCDIDLIRLITPNTTKKRLEIIANNASGFLYYVTITGITGQKSANIDKLKSSIKKIRKYSKLPIVAGFGINNKKNVKEICKIADGAVVGSSIIKLIEKNLNNKKRLLKSVGNFVEDLKKGTDT
jgi:tryptophan synthase alpha chain